MATSAGLPARLGRYAVRRRIGSGGFATVWLAYDEQLDSPVAVKVLGDIWTEDHQIRQRFVEEGRYLRKVESPYVVSVYDAGELEDGRPYLVMSYADQGTLADRLDAGLTPAQALQVVREIGAGLQALHDRGVLHRDVKPANVLFRSVDGSGVRAMLGDLGLGKALDGSSRLTMIAGTPSFIAPEQAAAESPGPPADQYSLAALTYLLLTGRRPFDRQSLSDAARPIAREPVSTPERPFPEAVEVVLGRALSFAPADRYRSVTEFVRALESALASVLADGLSAPPLTVDPDLTQPGARPSLPTDRFASSDANRLSGSAPEQPFPVTRRRWRGLLVGVPVGLAALVAGAGAGYAAQRAQHPDVELFSANGTLSVTVPDDWDRARSTDQWRPPDAKQDYDAISSGTSTRWGDVESRQQGVFLGLLPGTALPPQLPQHPECDSADTPSRSTSGGRATVTVVYRGCPGGVTVERVARVTEDELLWIQVRSATQGTAAQVLDSVAVHGV